MVPEDINTCKRILQTLIPVDGSNRRYHPWINLQTWTPVNGSCRHEHLQMDPADMNTCEWILQTSTPPNGSSRHWPVDEQMIKHSTAKQQQNTHILPAIDVGLDFLAISHVLKVVNGCPIRNEDSEKTGFPTPSTRLVGSDCLLLERCLKQNRL